MLFLAVRQPEPSPMIRSGEAITLIASQIKRE